MLYDLGGVGFQVAGLNADKLSREREGFLAWMKENVLDKTPEAFAAHAKRSAA